MKSGRLAACMILSAAVHVGIPAAYVGASNAYPSARRFAGEQIENIRGSIDRLEIQYGRQQLVNEARAQLQRGEFRMGEFLLRAGELDARERGERPDTGEARARYNDFLRELRGRLAEGGMVQEAVPEILSDVRYFGGSGDGMLELLLNNGGSCVPLSHTVASMVYDAGGHEGDIFLRSYPPNGRGYAHMAPIYREGENHFDLVLGDYAYIGGTQRPASSVIEEYAERHGLLDMRLGVSSRENQENPAEDMGQGTFPGSMPLFGGKAIAGFSPGQRRRNRSAYDEMPEIPWEGIRGIVIEELEEILAASESGAQTGPGVFYVEAVGRPMREDEGSRRIRLEFLDDDLGDHSRLADRLEGWLRSTGLIGSGYDNGRRALVLSYLAELYQRIENGANSDAAPEGYGPIAQRAGRRRDEVVSEALRLLREARGNDGSRAEFVQGIREQTAYSNIGPHTLSFLGREGIDFYLGNLTDGNSTMELAYFLSHPSTRENALHAAAQLSPYEYVRLIGTVYSRIDNCGSDCFGGAANVHGKAYEAFAAIMGHPSLRRYANTEIDLGMSNLAMELTDDHEGLVDGPQTERHLEELLASSGRKIDFGGPSGFTGIISGIVRSHGLGSEWEDAFITVFAESEVSYASRYRIAYELFSGAGRDSGGLIEEAESRFRQGDGRISHAESLFLENLRNLSPSFEFLRDFRAWLRTKPRGEARDGCIERVDYYIQHYGADT